MREIQYALRDYDKYQTKYKSLFDKVTSIKTEPSKSDIKKSTITLYSKEKKILTANYEICGIYLNKYKTWIWSWAITTINKNESFKSRKILEYGLNITTDNFKNRKEVYLKDLLKIQLVTSRIKISSSIQLLIHISLAGYLSKNPIIFPFTNKKFNFVTYFFLSNIKIH